MAGQHFCYRAELISPSSLLNPHYRQFCIIRRLQKGNNSKSSQQQARINARMKESLKNGESVREKGGGYKTWKCDAKQKINLKIVAISNDGIMSFAWVS